MDINEETYIAPFKACPCNFFFIHHELVASSIMSWSSFNGARNMDSKFNSVLEHDLVTMQTVDNV